MFRKAPLRIVLPLLKALCRGSGIRFRRSLASPKIAQERLLSHLVNDLALTEYGRHCGLTRHDDYAAFAAKIPVQDYEALAPWIERQLASPRAILTPHRVVHAEPTSGSSGAVKRIPYTRPLLGSFAEMFRIWVDDLLRHLPPLETGRLFISLSAATGNGGFSDDREYLPPVLKMLLSPFLIFPPPWTSDSKDFQRHLAETLLAEKDLEIISVWSPSYLLVLLETIQAHRERLALTLTPERQSALLQNPVDWQGVWPRLKLISCWDQAQAEPLAKRLQAMFPEVRLQGKGLLATEGPVTVPLTNIPGGVPLVTEVFLEFEDDSGNIHRLHELGVGGSYQVILSQSGGLTRYRLNDRVSVVDFTHRTPCLRFEGRVHSVSDLVGEKLNEAFVRQALLSWVPSGRFLLVPEERGYVLLVDAASAPPEPGQIDTALCEAFHYGRARQLGQINPIRILRVEDLLGHVQAFWGQSGIRLGDIKDVALVTNIRQAEDLLATLDEKSALLSPEGDLCYHNSVS